ncbi:nudix hydrolase 10-like isoform X2 [Actinidia eriantha]|uniref:nudix hydrolase 10-like isoform X2 n=1 Tax=Actinidia eriantha TaxID=165200 RepID=UPI002588A4DB|nr:nudix hydrolase 10-like isoform X2 [Actinidia eriantha]
MDQVVAENGVQHVELLSSVNDDHGGVIVEMKEPMDSEAFHSLLRVSISQWKQQEGFLYHHAEPHYLMLVYWIPETVSTIPANATHRVRVGAIVMNDKRELLVVQEKIGRYQGTGVWKIPTGVADESEDIFAAAVREVKEETGIDTEFVEILAFRQIHKVFFDKSDLCFLCMMHPLSFDIQAQELEIEAAQWMPLEEYAAQPFCQSHGLAKYISEICLAKLERDYVGFLPLPITSYFNDQVSCLYLNSHDLNN